MAEVSSLIATLGTAREAIFQKDEIARLAEEFSGRCGRAFPDLAKADEVRRRWNWGSDYQWHWRRGEESWVLFATTPW